MVYTYKNFLIINRNDSISEAISMAQNMGMWFTDRNRIWHVKSPVDKMILVYRDFFRTDNIIKEYKHNAEVDFRPRDCVGYIQIYCQKHDVKVEKFRFAQGENTDHHWYTFKQYLIQTLKNSGMTTFTHPCTLHWNNSLCSKSHQLSMERLGLMSNRDRKIYTFTVSDIDANIPVVPFFFGGGSTAMNWTK